MQLQKGKKKRCVLLKVIRQSKNFWQPQMQELQM